jgi:protein required for attachment to host cells
MPIGKDLWVLVADGARARLMRRAEAAGRLALVWEDASTDAREKGSALTTDRPGRAFESGVSERRSAMAPPTDPKRHAKETFAARVAARVARELPATASLVLVAAPGTLGELRKRLGPDLIRRVTHQIDKDLTAVSIEEVEAQLRPVMSLPG